MSQQDSDEKALFRVKFEDGDPENPLNFSKTKKVFIASQMASLALVGTVGSSIITPAQQAIAEYTHVGRETSVLAMSLFLLGFAFGPLIWAPLAEVYGRRWSVIPAVFVLGIFSIGTATSKTAAAIFVTRFLGGVFAAAPASNGAAVLGDIYSAKVRGVAIAFFAACLVGGPSVAPLVGAALTNAKGLGWRWTGYIEAIFAFATSCLAAVCLSETYAPVLLSRKARKMRSTTGDDRWWHPQESEKVSVDTIVAKYLSRPLRMFFTEPSVTYIAVYASFVYGLLFLALEVYPIVFLEQRGFGPVASTLPLLGILAGVFCAMAINIANQPFYIRAMKKNNNKPIPEARLPPMIAGSVLFTTGLFWFGWTASPKYHWALPTVAGGFIGAGFNIVFQQCINFLVDTYGPLSASAVAANTFLRSLFAFGLPLAARPMFINMGVGPAASVLGGISCLALPMPFVFMRYGPAMRRRSKFARD